MVQVLTSVLYDRGLSPLEFRLFGVVLEHDRERDRRGFYGKQETLASYLDRKPRTIQLALDKLVRLGYLTCTPQGDFKTNVYHVADKHRWRTDQK
jgi:hypothetical protein